MPGLFDDLIPARRAPSLATEPTDEELAAAQRPAVMVRSRSGAPVLLPNTPEPAPSGPTAAWFGPGSMADTTGQSASLSLSGAFARMRQAMAHQQGDEQAKQLEQIAQPNPMGVRFPATTAARIARLAAGNKRTGEQQGMIASGAEAEHAAVQPANMSDFQQMVRSGTDSGVSMLPGLAFGMLNPVLGATIAGILGGGQQAGSTYGEALDKLSKQREDAKVERDFLGRPTGRVLDQIPYTGALPDSALHSKANFAAGLDAMSEVGGEYLPFHAFFKPGSSFARRLTESVLTNTGEEAGTQILQSINQKANYDPNYTLNDALHDIKIAAGAGGLMGAAGGGAGHAIIKAQEADQKNQIAKTVADLLNQNIDATQFTPGGIDRAARAALSPSQDVEQRLPMQGVTSKDKGPTRPYESAPDALMGYRAQGPQKPADETNYPFTQPVRVTFDNGDSIIDAMPGLNQPHAMERARRNWEGAKIEPVSQEEFDADEAAYNQRQQTSGTDSAAPSEELSVITQEDDPNPFPAGMKFAVNGPTTGTLEYFKTAREAEAWRKQEQEFQDNRAQQMSGSASSPAPRSTKPADVERSSNADKIAAMPEEKRDNTEIGDFPGHRAAYDLYEARKMVPKPSDKLKRVNDNNSFSLSHSHEYIANVDGEHYGITKQEDPDDPDNDSSFVYAYSSLDRDSPLVVTSTNDQKELLAEIRKARDERQPMSGTEDNARYANQIDDTGANQAAPTANRPATETGSIPDGRGLSGRAGRIQGEGGSHARVAPLAGLPAKVEIPGRGVIEAGPFQKAHDAARDYARKAGIDYRPQTTYAKIDKARATKIANEFDRMQHAPDDPTVKAAYDAMIKETIAQWQAIKATGLKVEFIKPGQPDPYAASPRLATLDVTDSNHLWVYPTDSGFGTDETAPYRKGNPLLKLTDEVIDGKRARANDIFRIVHDYFGHIKDGVGFRAEGEENAWRSHSAMYSPLARRAMTTETRGQNSWLNYGPHGETNRTAKVEDTVFAEQKIGLMPEWVSEEGASDQQPTTADASNPAPAAEQQQSKGDAFTRLGLKTENPEHLGFASKIEINSIGKLTGENLAKVSQALDIAIANGLPEAYVKDVAAFVQYSPMLATFKAAYWPKINTIGINTDSLKNFTVPQLATFLAHEIAHHIDNATTGGAMRGENYITANSARTQFTLTPTGDGNQTIEGNESAGDLINEILDSPDREIQTFFEYPMLHLAAGRMDAQIGSAEFFAQVSALYNANPTKVRALLPKWAKVMRAVYGEKISSQAAPNSIGEARSRLRQALQNDRAIVENDGHISRPDNAQTNDQPDRSSDSGGQARVRVGGRNSQNQGTPPGQPPGPGSSGPANAPGQPSGQWGINEPGLIDNLIREFQNNKIDLHRVTDAIEKVAGTLPIDQNPVLAEELFKGRVRATINRFEKTLVKPLLKGMAEAHVTPDELGKYLWAVHAPERNAQMAKVNPGAPLDNNLSGLSNAEAAQILADIKKSGKLADMKRLAQMVYDITTATQQVLVSKGLEDQSTIDTWNSTYKNYVPLFRDSDEAQAGAGFIVKGAESKRAMGSTKEAIAIVAAVIAQHERALIRAEKAIVGRQLINLAETHPAPNFWKVDTPPTKRVVNKTTGLVEEIIDPLYKNRDDTFIVKELVNGKVRERVLAFNPRKDGKHDGRALALSKAMRNLDAVQLGAFTQLAGNVTRLMANLATSWNPQFWLTNFARDVQTAAVNLQGTPLKGHAPQVMANIIPAMRGVISAEFNDGTGKWQDLYHRFEDAGGKMGFMNIFDDLKDRQREIAKEIARSQRSNINPLKWANIAMDSIEKVNAAVENGTRLAVFGEAIKMGLPDKQAASIAKNITVNFDRKGNRSGAIGAWYMFFNANIQGTAILMKYAASSPKVRGFIGVMAAFAAAMELINRMMGDADRDEDGNNPYELIPGYVKQTNMVFMLPKGDRTDQNKGVVTIPLPYGFSIFHNAGRLAMEAILRNSKFVDEKRTPGDLAMDFMGALANNFAPFGGTSTPLQYFAPTIVKPVVQQVENKTWYGAPIHPEPQQFGKAKSKSEQYFRSTSDTAKELSRFLNNVSGGDEIHGGALDIYPGNIEHVFSTISGGTGRFGLGMFDFTKHMINRATGEDKPEDMPWRNVPFVGKFYGEVDERDRAAKYYRLSKDAMQAFNEYKTYRKSGDGDKADAIEEAHPELIEMAKVIVSKRHKADMKSIREEFTAVDELPRDQRAKAKAGLRKDETDIMGEALRVYNEVLKERREGR